MQNNTAAVNRETDQKRAQVIQLMSMNRHDRRVMGKKYGVKIPGIVKPLTHADMVQKSDKVVLKFADKDKAIVGSVLDI